MNDMNEKNLGLLTDEELCDQISDIEYEKYVDLQGLGAATKAVTAAKAGSWAGSAASQL